MDGFDDLLSHSRQNPFQDPFAQDRSGSPDPWASFGQPSVLPNAEQPAFLGARSTTPTLESHGFSDSDAFQYTASGANVFDETSATNISEQTESQESEDESRIHTPPPLISPGSRGSLPDITNSVTNSEGRDDLRQPSSLPPSQPETSSSPSSPAPPATAPATYGSFVGHASRPSNASAFRAGPAYESPLGQSFSAVVEQSVAGVSLGGDAFNTWQSETSASPTSPQYPAGPSRGRSDSDSSDDDRPILQSAKLAASRIPALQASKLPSSLRTENGLPPAFIITVDDPQKVGETIRPYTMYTVHTKTTSPLFSKSSFSVLRRYSDFLWLYETLQQNNSGVVVPPVPEKNPYRRFDQNFVEQRRFALEKCIQKIANHPVLQKDADLKLFLESDTFTLDVKHRDAERGRDRGGLMATIGHSLAGPRFYETDEWFDRQKAYLDSLESQLRGLVKAIDLVAKHRSELAIATGEFAQTIADLSTSDLGPQLSSSFTGLAEVERKVQELHSLQSHDDMVTMMATVDEYARLINSVRMVFTSRIRTYHNWQSADAHLKRTKQTHETQRAQGRLPSDQLSRSLSLVADAERRALDAKTEFDQVSRLVKTEVARFEQERIEDFKTSLEAFLDGMISRQKELITSWENYQQKLLKTAAPVGQGTSTDVAPVS